MRQTDMAFEWIIVDDGSSDNTKDLVTEWEKEGHIDIVYRYQPNQGKHIAINTGIGLANGELFFIVDSDDTLTVDAVAKVRLFWNSLDEVSHISGIISYRQFVDGRLVGSKLPPEIKTCKLRDCRTRYGSDGDKVVIYRTDVFSRFRYPQFDGERFLGESYVFNQIDDLYEMAVMDDRIYNFDYQKDGLSQDFRKLYRENPCGMRVLMIQSLQYDTSFVPRLKTLSHVGCLSLYLHDTKTYARVGSVARLLMSFPLAVALYFRIFILKASDVKPYLSSQDN